MVELIVGKKGKGKTKVLLDRVNGAVKEANGSIVYLDKSTKHMYELNNKVRLIDVSSYPLKNADEFVGFICGIISQIMILSRFIWTVSSRFPSWKTLMLQIHLISWTRSVRNMEFQ